MNKPEDKHMFVGGLTNITNNIDQIIRDLAKLEELEVECAWEMLAVSKEFKKIRDEIEDIIYVTLNRVME